MTYKIVDLSYAMPLLVRILARFTGHAKVLPGPYTLGKWGVVLNIIGFVFLLFTSITFNFPTLNPVTKDDMNYTSAAIGVIGFVSAVTWITTGRKHFTGPQTGIANVNVVEARAMEYGVGNDHRNAAEHIKEEM